MTTTDPRTTDPGTSEPVGTTPPETSAGSRAAWPLVAQREVMVKLRDRSFLIGTLVSLVIIVALFAFQAYNAEKHRDFDVAVTSSSAAMADQLAQAVPEIDDKVGVTPVEVADEDAARAALADESVDVWLHEGEDGWVLTGQTDVDSSLSGAVEPALARIVLAANAEEQGADLAALERGSTLSTELVEGDADEMVVARVVGVVMAVLFYMAAALFGMTLAMSVVEEKQSRIVEIISTSIPVRQLLIGKLVGNIALAMLQLALYVVVALVGVSFTPYGDMLPSLSAGLVWFLVFFLVGFTLIATLYAVAGALASRTEDVQSTSVPVTMLVMAMFFGAIFVQGAAIDWLSYVPPFSAILMPMQVVSGEATWWQALLALVLLLAAAGVVLVLAERIYRRALLQTSGKLGYRQAWNAEV